MIRPDSEKKKGYNFWACSGYPECKASFPDKNGRPGELQEKKDPPPASEHECPECGKPLVHRTGKSKSNKPFDFYGCSGFPKCKASFEAKDGKPDIEGKKDKVK